MLALCRSLCSGETIAMKALEPALHFDPSKPFYGIVLGYLTQVHGFIEICSRGILSRLQRDPREKVELWLKRESSELVKEFLRSALAGGGVTPLFGQQQLASNTAKEIRVNIEDLAKEVLPNYNEGIKYFNRASAGGVLILAWEVTNNHHSHHDLWEFLRHCRHAAAHRGHFHFLHGEPKRPARWRSLEIVPALQGQPLFTDPPVDGFIGTGDVLHLLADIEAAFPEIL
jgi:hypothetical protein